MASFRGSDDSLDAEIATLEGIARLRVRRYARDLDDLNRDLRELKAERGRRKARAAVPGSNLVGETSTASG